MDVLRYNEVVATISPETALAVGLKVHATRTEVVEHYDLLRNLSLAADEKADLEGYLKSL